MALTSFILLMLMLTGLSTQEPQAAEKPDISPDFFWWLFNPYYYNSNSNYRCNLRQCQLVAENRICAYDSNRGWQSFRNTCSLNEYNRCYGYNYIQNSTGFCLTAG